MSEKVLYPLNQSQMLMMYQLKFVPKKQVVNICVDIQFDSEIDHDLMYQALYMGMMRSPGSSVRLNYDKKTKTVTQYFTEDGPDKIVYLDLSDKTDEEYEEIISKWSATPFPNDHMHTQLYRLVFLKRPNGKYGVYGCFSHVCFDAYAIMMHFYDIQKVYIALRDGKPLPEAPMSPLAAYEGDYKYAETPMLAADEKYFREGAFATELQYTNIAGVSNKAFRTDKKYGNQFYTLAMRGAGMNIDIDRAVSDAIDKFAEENQIPAHTLYLLGLKCRQGEVCETNDVMIMDAVARRGSAVQKKCGGTMVNSVPIRFTFDNDITFMDAAKQVYRQQLSSYRHSNRAGSALLRDIDVLYKHPKMTTYISTSLSYQPFFNLDPSVPVTFRRVHSGAVAAQIEISVMPYNSNGDLCFNFAYQPHVFTEKDLRDTVDFILRFLEAGIADPEKKIGTIIEELK